MTPEQRELLTPEESAHYDDRECRDCDQAESVEFMANKLVEARAHIQALEEANAKLRRVVDISPFCLTLQGDDYCLWCQREKPNSDDWKDWKELQSAEFHNAGCEFVAALSPAPATTEKL